MGSPPFNSGAPIPNVPGQQQPQLTWDPTTLKALTDTIAQLQVVGTERDKQTKRMEDAINRISLQLSTAAATTAPSKPHAEAHQRSLPLVLVGPDSN